MRILYLTQILSPSIGGGELLFFNFAKGMLKLGHQVHIICHKKKHMGNNDKFLPSSDIATLEQMGGNVHYVKPEQEDRGGISFSKTIFKAFKMHVGYTINAIKVANGLIKEGKIDIIHANMYTPVIPASILGKIRHIPVVITLHNLMNWTEWSLQKNIPRYTSIVGPIYEKMILKMPVHTIHVESKKVKDELAQVNPKAKAVVIYNGVEIQEYISPNSKPEYNKFILYLGRLVRGKNLQVVIHAFKDVVKVLPEAKLMVAGDGPMRQEWQELVDKNNLTINIIFLGHISDGTTKLELLSKCSAVVIPSIYEGFAMVPIEAFAIGKPVLMSDVKPSDEIVNDNIDGFLIPPHDSTKWAEKIVYMLNNPQICEDMGKKGRNKVIETFNTTTVSNKMEQLYKNIISNSK